MRLLITGGAGFIGSNFVRHVLTETTHSITTLDALTYAGSKDNLNGVLGDPRHRFVEGDIRNSNHVRELVSEADVIINFAAESHVDRSIQNSERFVFTNVQGTRNLLDSAVDSDVDRFIQISTDEVYGQISEGSFSESDPLNPRNPYAATKASADLLVQSYHSTYGLPVMILRPSNNYGPRQHHEKLIPKFVLRAASGNPVPLYGDGSHVREWTYVDDTARAILVALEKGRDGEIYNISSSQELENQEVTRRILNAVDASENLIEFVEDRPGHDQRYALDTTKIESLGWEPRFSFGKGLRRTVEYYTS